MTKLYTEDQVQALIAADYEDAADCHKELLWNGTMQLRYVRRIISRHGGGLFHATEVFLQQRFYCDETGQHEWRDIPLEIES